MFSGGFCSSQQQGWVWAELSLLLSRSPFVKCLAASWEEVSGWEGFFPCNVKSSLWTLLRERGQKTGKLLSFSSSSWCAFLLRRSQKRKEGCSRQVLTPTLFGQYPAAGSCFCGRESMQAAQPMCLGQLLLNQQRQQAGETLKHYAIKYLKKAVSLVFFWLVSRSILQLLCWRPESNQRYPGSLFKYFVVFI